MPDGAAKAWHPARRSSDGPDGVRMTTDLAIHPSSPMKSLADALPPDIARQVHPDWRKNEAAYWAVRDQLLGQYRGRWIGFADGAVMADAATPLEVFLAVHHSGRHPFVVRVGHEHEPWYRI